MHYIIYFFSRSSERSMKRSWGFLIPKYYNYSFKNFYATVIQRAYRNYKKRTASLAKRVWEAVRNDGTPDRWKYLGIDNKSSQPGYICYGDGDCYPVRNDWMFEKRAQLWIRLDFVAYILVNRGVIRMNPINFSSG